MPLSVLLSQALVAFTIEFDNEFEHRAPHRTTVGGGHGAWLSSMVMWFNCMRFAGEEGITLQELHRRALTPTNFNGMQRWGYIVVGPDSLIRATNKGRRAQAVWGPLFGVIEGRWRERFGTDRIGQLRKSLWEVASQFEFELPDCLPILGYGLFSRGPEEKRRAPVDPDLPLPALLARVLLAFALEFERESDLSLAISADVVRVLDEAGVRVRDLPLLSGVSKEAIAMALGFLQKRGFAVVEPDPAGSRSKIARLTAKGLAAQAGYYERLGLIEEHWRARFGRESVARLGELLERMSGDLFRGLEPYPDGWRASVPRPRTLPHYPMVLHRGGYPDGS
ncbi:MAG: MarR family winged helix-turn-helix transcriptional regulator [Bryobacteraceae bacterium]